VTGFSGLGALGTQDGEGEDDTDSMWGFGTAGYVAPGTARGEGALTRESYLQHPVCHSFSSCWRAFGPFAGEDCTRHYYRRAAVGAAATDARGPNDPDLPRGDLELICERCMQADPRKR